jgi:hypothetical protein
VILQSSCGVSYSTFLLPCSTWTCEDISPRSTSSCFASSSTAASPCVYLLRLWFCGHSEIESKSSRFRCLCPRRLIASNLGRYKASYLLFYSELSSLPLQVTLFITYYREDRMILYRQQFDIYQDVSMNPSWFFSL